MSRDATASVVSQLPFKRIIILSNDNMRWLSAACAISLAQSPMLRADRQGCCSQIIVASQFNTPKIILSAEECLIRGMKSIPSLNALETLCHDITQGTAVLQRVGLAVDAAQCPGVMPPHFTADFTHDVYVYIAAWGDAKCGDHTPIASLASLTHTPHPQQTQNTTHSTTQNRPYGRLIILADDASRPAVCAAATHALLTPVATAGGGGGGGRGGGGGCSWRLFLGGAPHFAPPADDLRLARAVVRRGGIGRGVLEAVALGVALGVLRRLPVGFRDPLPVTPLDLAARAALLALALQQENGKIEGCNGQEEEGMRRLSVEPVAREGLVWGMLAEYLMDYYGRLGPRIASDFPMPKLMDPQPTLQLNASVPDWINYGCSLMMPFKRYFTYCEVIRRKQLMDYFPGSKTSRYVRAAIDNIDMVVHDITGVAKPHAFHTQSISSNNQSPPIPKLLSEAGTVYYSFLLQEVMCDESLRLLYPQISLSAVKWDLFVKFIAQGVIEHFAWQVSNRPLSLPPPLPQYHNDIVFHGTRRALPTNLCPRKFFTDVHWAVRCGMHPDGIRVSTEPGLTKDLEACILAQPGVLKAIDETAKAEDTSIDVVKKRSESILRTIGDNLNQVQVRAFGLVVRRVLFQLYDEVTLNTDAFERLCGAFSTPRVHIMLLPSHRSYMDFLIVTYLLVSMNFPPPHVCAGEDFLQLGPISKFMSGSGAFFVRRSFRGDKLYQTICKEYVRQLVLHCRVMEFFIEGTRSRTGKMLPPKLGILKFVTDTFFEEQNLVDDVYILPISLSYDELLEAKLYADEQLGVSKPKESLRNLLRVRSLLKTRHGKLHVHVGKVLSLRQFRDNPYQCPAPFEPIKAEEMQNLSISYRKEIKSLTPLPVLNNFAWHITHNIQENTVITPTALLATILSVFAPTATGMLFNEVYKHMKWLRFLIIRRGGVLSTDCTVEDIKGMTHYAISHLSTFVEVVENNRKVVIRQDIGSLMGVGIYSNQLIHVFLDEAVIAVVAHAFGKLNRSGRSIYVEKIELINGCQQLRKLLSAEFQDYLPSCPYTFTSWFEYTLSKFQSLTADDNDNNNNNNNDGKADDCDYNYYYKPDQQHLIVRRGSTHCNPTDGKNKETEKEGLRLASVNAVSIPITKQFSFLNGILFPFVESAYIISLALHAITDAGGERELRKSALLMASRKVGLDLYNSKQLIMRAQSCGSDALKFALEGALLFTSLKSDLKAREPTYVLPEAVPFTTVTAEMHSLLTQVRRLHAYSVLTSAEEREKEREQEQSTKALFLTSYRELIVATASAKM